MDFKRVLVVDDEQLMREFLVEILQRNKYFVESLRQRCAGNREDEDRIL